MVKPIILDLGSYNIKFGLSGDTKPKTERAVYGYDSTDVDSKEKASDDDSKNGRNEIYGNRVIEMVNENAQKRVKSALVPLPFSIDSHLIPFLKSHLFDCDESLLSSDCYPILMTSHVSTSTSDKSKIMELLFENFDSPSLYFELSTILSLYATARLNGLMVDIGHNNTSIAPIVEGYCIDSACKALDIGSSSVSKYLSILLRKAGITYHTAHQMELVNVLKENVVECKESCFNITSDDDEFRCTAYKMPDGSILQIGNARFRASEMYFGPHLIGKECEGIDSEIMNCISECDLFQRRSLMSNVTLVGGGSKLKGFGKRLVNELVRVDYNRFYVANKELVKNKKTSVRVRAPINRDVSAWIGGSVITNIDEFNDMWITRKQYNEEGKNVLFRKNE